MNDQLRQAYDIDNRRAGTYTQRAGQPISATDNDVAKNFLASYAARKRAEQNPDLSAERGQEDRFIVNVGGSFPSATIGFKNNFRAR
tara:strand:+ start:983 stop:1243 length:261 start_codon:yes stop_codon:yes gene_type:complete